MKEETRITVRLPKETAEKLRTLAEESCRTPAGYVRYLVLCHLRENEPETGKKMGEQAAFCAKSLDNRAEYG